MRTTVVSFVGTGIGAVSQILLPFVFPEEDQIGALSLLNSISRIFATIFTLGFAQITLQVFAYFRNEEHGHSGFLMFAVLFSLIGSVLGLLSFYALQDYFVGVGNDYRLIRSISYLIFPIIFFKIFYTNLDAYMRMLFSSVAGAFWEGLMLKLMILISVLLFWLGWIDYTYTAYIYSFALSLPGIALIILSFMRTNEIKLPQRSYFTRDTRKDLTNYGIYGILGAASGVLVVSIDQVMLNKMIGTDAVGVYSVLFFAGVLISIPARGVKRIVVPVLAESWKKKDYENIEKVYEKSVTNQTVIGIYLFVAGWLCIEPALSYLPDYAHGLYVFFFIGLGQLFDMMTGVNVEVIATSERYRMNTYFNIVLAGLVICLNFFFILEWNIVGAALASAIAMLAVNFSRWYYLKRKFGFQPFSLKVLIAALLGGALIALFKFIPLDINPLGKMVIYALTVTLVYWTAVIKFNLAPDTNQWLLKLKKRFL